jgi:dipeptidase
VIAVGRDATVDGSTLIAHTDDAGGGAADVRLVRVPAQDHDIGAQRAVYNFFGGFPRLVSKERGRHYFPRQADEDDGFASEQVMEPLGLIPQVPHTYAYFDQDYGMMNEVQLSIGESTCGAKTVGWPLDAPGGHGKNLFGVAELSKVALERCESARCAVKTMGELAVEYGFYSEDSGDPQNPDFGDSAEALVIGDKFGEVWVFHVLTGQANTSAIWAAQRVPEGHVTALANGFTIREMDLEDPDWYLASSNVVSFAQEMGWWDPSSSNPFDFTAAYGFADKDAVGPLYTGRRIWRVFDVLAPSLELDARLGSFSEYATYPFSVKPDALIEINTVMELLRDHYEGTKYDMTKGIAAGPFGSPVRWGGNSQGVIGGWERPISMYRTMFSFVLQMRGGDDIPDAIGGVAWYAQSAPHGSVYVPFACTQDEIPESYLVGKQSEFHPKSAWWAFNFVNNWSLLRFNAINQNVRNEIGTLQKEALRTRAQMELHATANLKNDSKKLHAFMEKQSNDFATLVVDRWWRLAWVLVAKFSDGYVTTGEEPQQMQAPGYPAWWLELSEFSKWPGDTFTPKLSMRAKLTGVGSTMNTSEKPDGRENGGDDRVSSPSSPHGVLATLGWIASGFVLGASVLAFAQRRKREGYSSLA